MNEWLERAVKKLEDEREAGAKVSREAGVMAGPVAEALAGFCRQEAEFAQAVVQGGGFDKCMAVVSKGAGKALSDLETYRRAVQFYFPGAEVRFHMTVDLVGTAVEEEEPAKGLLLDFTDFL